MKKSIPLLLLIVLGTILLGCSNPITEDSFSKKEECGAKLNETIEKHKQSDEKLFGENPVSDPTVVEAVFYSSSMNSCLEAYYYGEVYVISDLLTGENVYFDNVYQDDKGYDRFKAKIDELK